MDNINFLTRFVLILVLLVGLAEGESEKQTRKQRINAKLKALGWKFAPEGKPAPKGPYWRDEIETDNGPADYGLFLDDKLIGSSRQKLGLAPQNVLSQTERYAEGVKDGPHACNGYGVPFIYGCLSSTARLDLCAD